MRDNWRYTIGVLLVTAASLSLGAVVSQTAEQTEEDKGNAKLECDAYTLEGIAPAMTYTQVEDLLKARSPKPQLAAKQRRHDSISGWQAVHSWHVTAGTLEVWYAGGKANRKTNPMVIRVRLLVPENGMDANSLWKSVFDRFGPMSTLGKGRL